MITRISAGLSLSLLALAACTDAPSADRIMTIPEAVQVQAHGFCQAQQGLAGGAPVEILELSNGGVIATTINGNGVTIAQARAVNQCARARMLSGNTTAVAPVQARPAVAAAPVAAQQQTHAGVPGCVPGAGVIQGGLRMCPGY